MSREQRAIIGGEWVGHTQNSLLAAFDDCQGQVDIELGATAATTSGYALARTATPFSRITVS